MVVLAYPQGENDHCVCCAAASALHHYGDFVGAATIFTHAECALRSGDAVRYVVDKLINTKEKTLRGWSAENLRKHDPLMTVLDEPVLLQLVSTLGDMDHVVATVGELLFDPTTERAVPITREALDRCVGVEVDGARYARVGRAVVLRAGAMVQKRIGLA